MAGRPVGVPHPLSWVRRLDSQRWDGLRPPAWGFAMPEELSERGLAFELVYCAVELDVDLAEAARKLGVGQRRARRLVDMLRDEAAPRRGRGTGPLSDSGILKRLVRERERAGRICLAPGCGNRIDPRKRRGTYACSGRCRKRIFDAGGREAIVEERRLELERQARARRERQLPPATPLIVRCSKCGATFSGAGPSQAFREHNCRAAAGAAPAPQPSPR